MAERESDDDRDYPDGSVGRYVREQWGAVPSTRRSRRGAGRGGTPLADGERAEPEPEPAPDERGQEPGPAGSAPVTPAPVTPPEPHDGELGDDAVLDDDMLDAWTGSRAGDAVSAPPTDEPAAADDAAVTDPGFVTHPGDDAAVIDPGDAAATGHGHPASPGPPVGPPGSQGPVPAPGPSPIPPAPRTAPPDDRPFAEPPIPPVVPRPAAQQQPPPPYREPQTREPQIRGPQIQQPGPGFAQPRHPGPRHSARPPAPPPAAGPPAGPPAGTPAAGSPAGQQARPEPRVGTDLSSARLLRPTRRPPQSGWRRLVYVLSGRLINPGESPADVRRRELTTRVNQPLLGCYKIAMLSLKGGVGKTTVTATLGATFASLRGDRVVAVDANPDRGTLSQKIPLETSATVRNLLRDAQRVRRYTDVRAYTSQGASRLEVLASEQDPAVSEAFSEDDYRRTVNLLEHFYNIVLTDCGTGLMHSAMYGVLGVADQLIIVSSSSIDGARSASATMDWLDAHGHEDLVRNAVAVVNNVSRSSGGVDLDRVAEHFAARCRAVVRIPFDAHLQEGAEVDLDRLEPATRLALLELAATMADAFDSAYSRR